MNLKSRVRFFSLIVFCAAGMSLLSAQTLLPPAQPYAAREPMDGQEFGQK
jgi:hypothetical protein